MKFSLSPVSPAITATPMGCVVVDLENPTSTDPVTVSLGRNPSDGTLSGTLTKNAVAGVVLFDDLEIDLSGLDYTLVATAPQQRNKFQPGYYYNYPPCGTIFSENTVSGNYPHANIPVEPVTESVSSNVFDVTT